MGTSDDEIKKLLSMPETKDWAKEWQEKGWFNDEKPCHSVMVDSFEIGKYPVTNAEYQRFVKATNYRPPAHWSGTGFPEEIAAHPVVNVSWDDAVAYCAWLTDELQKAKTLREGETIRLPTEAEWEKAAAWDDAEQEKRRWAWGNEWDKTKCNTSEGGPGTITPVGKYSPAGDSPCGAVDMTGNVWEWCSSLYKPYPYRVYDGRENPEEREPRILRGGAWYINMLYAHSAYRHKHDPIYGTNDRGFRCAKSSRQEQMVSDGSATFSQ